MCLSSDEQVYQIGFAAATATWFLRCNGLPRVLPELHGRAQAFPEQKVVRLKVHIFIQLHLCIILFLLVTLNVVFMHLYS